MYDDERFREMDKHLLKTTFKEEASELPFDLLEDDEKEPVRKCLQGNDMSYEEFKQLRQTLKNYRGVLKKYDLEKAEENIDQTVKIITTEKDLLSLIDNEDRYDLDMYYFINGEKVLLKLKVNPLTDSQYVYEMDSHARLFKELNTQERALYSKSQQGVSLTPEEAKMVQALEQKLEDKIFTGENVVKNINEFLARQVEFKECSIPKIEDRVKFWSKIDPSTRVSLYNKVRQILNLNETFEDDLFPVSQ